MARKKAEEDVPVSVEIQRECKGFLSQIQLDGLCEVLFGVPYMSQLGPRQLQTLLRRIQTRKQELVEERAAERAAKAGKEVTPKVEKKTKHQDLIGARDLIPGYQK